MVGLSKNSSSQISRTNVHMHANEDTWEIRQTEGLRVTKMMGTKRPVTRTRAAIVGSRVMTRAVTTTRTTMLTRAVMTTRTTMMTRAVTTTRTTMMTRAVMTTWTLPLAGPTIMPLAADMRMMIFMWVRITRMSDICGSKRIGIGRRKRNREVVDFTDDNGSYSMRCSMNCELFEFISLN
jgi:hypothetical protein